MGEIIRLYSAGALFNLEAARRSSQQASQCDEGLRGHRSFW